MALKPNPIFATHVERLMSAKGDLLKLWTSYEGTLRILNQHLIEPSYFIQEYASGVFDYFVSVFRGETQIGDCPVIEQLLEYLKDREVTADELFLLCSHFRRAMVDISYELGINNKELFDEISYVYDLNFAGVLKRYTDTIYQKELEIRRNVKLLEEYRRAIDVSAIVSKTDAEGIITYANDKLSRACGYRPEQLVGSPHSIMRHPDMPDQFFKDLWETITDNRVFKGTIKNRTKEGEGFYVDTTIVPITDTGNRIVEYMAISYEVTDLVVAKEEAIEAGEAKEYFLTNMSHEIRTPLNAILGFVELLKDEVKTAKERRFLDIVHNSGETLLGIINDILDFSKLRSGEFAIEPRTFNLHKTIAHTLELFVPSANRHQTVLTSFIDPRIPYELISDPLRIQQVISNLLSNAIKFTPPYGEIRLEASFNDDTVSISVSDTGIGITKKDIVHIFDPFTQARSNDGASFGGTGLGLSISAQLVRHMGGDISVASQPGLGSTFTIRLPVTVGGQSRPGLMDIALLHKRALALLDSGTEFDAMTDSLERYLTSFGVTLERITDVSAPYDLLFFSEHAVSVPQREAIIADPRPAIALMDAPEETYDTVLGVTPLVMPLYCSKLQETLETVLSDQAAASPLFCREKRKRFKGKVLVAEDNEANLELIKTMLENAGVRYDLASNGVKALSRMKSGGYDLVLMDEQMPIMSGLEAVSKLREYEAKMHKPPLPVIAVSANVLGGSEMRKVYDGFVEKPVSMELLTEVMERYLESESDAPDVKAPTYCDIAFNRTLLCELLQISDSQLDTLLGVYMKKMRHSLQTLKRAIAEGDLAAVARTAHAIKGSSSNFRLETVTHLAQTIESEARAGSNADYAKLYESLHTMYVSIENSID